MGEAGSSSRERSSSFVGHFRTTVRFSVAGVPCPAVGDRLIFMSAVQHGRGRPIENKIAAELERAQARQELSSAIRIDRSRRHGAAAMPNGICSCVAASRSRSTAGT